MQKIIVLILIISTSNTQARQMVLSASSIVSEDDTQTFDLSFGSEIFKNGFIELSGSKSTYEDDEEDTAESKSSGLSYSHDLNQYLSLRYTGYRSNESEFITSKESEGAISININRLWGSYYLTTITVGTGEKDTSFFQDLVLAASDIDLLYKETRSFIGLSHELNDNIRLKYAYTKHTYDEDPNSYLEEYPLVAVLFPDYASMVYGFLDESSTLSMSINYKKYSAYLSHSIYKTLIEGEVEKSSTLNIGYAFKWIDLNVILSENSQPGSNLKSSGLELSYYF